MSKKTAQQKIGDKGEKIATTFLVKHGYTIKHSNYRIGRSEIDIIAEIDSEIVFIEVKTRTTGSFGYPETFVSEQQQKLLIDASEVYIQDQKQPLSVRFDIVAIILDNNIIRVRHFKDAFWPQL